MNKKIISIIAAAAIAAGTMTAFAEGDEKLYSKDTEEIKAVITNMSEADKEEFINENLSKELQHLSHLVTISSNQATEEMADEVNAALKDGLTAVQIKEAIYHSAAYCGYTRAAKALDAADEALKAAKKSVRYSSRITSTEKNRYNDGLEVQRFLFGPQIGTITDDMSDAMKLQTLYLSGICFGDFYNRIGLPLYTREFLTFNTIVGNGNCQGQLTGHANGNLNVGHSTDMLRAAVLLNADINGEEKTEQALGVINSVEREPAEDVKDEPKEKKAVTVRGYSSDSEELLGTMEHYKTDDKDNFIGTQLTEEQQEAVKAAAQAVVDGTEIPTSDDKATQLLIDVSVMTSQGGRESEIPAKLAENIEAGNTVDMMLAVPLACVPYNGFPRTLNMMAAINNAVTAASATPNPEATAASEATTAPASTAAPEATAVPAKTTVTMQIGNPKLTIDGKETDIDVEGTVPVIRNDRTLLPVRAFVEGIGGKVAWDEAARKVTLTYEDRTIELVIDSPVATLNGNEKTLDTAPVIINERTMLPIRFIAESFGYVVSWDESTQTVTIEN